MGSGFTKKQEETLDSLGYFDRGAIHASKCREEKLFGFCFADQDTGDRYLTNGSEWGKEAILVRPDGTTDSSAILTSARNISLEEIQQYLVIDGNLGIKIAFTPGYRLEIHVFPALDTVNNNSPQPFWMSVGLLADMSRVSNGEEECLQGWKVGEFKLNISGGGRISIEEAERLLIGQKIAIEIAKNFKDFIKSPKFWLNRKLLHP